jgi:pimeloyl-ACP methyl ester carboxylesterase
MADTIFMIHGMWAGGWYWENYVKLFGDKGYRCVPKTLRYHDAEDIEAWLKKSIKK